MTDAVSRHRAYDNSSRAQAAADTRRRILETARRLMVDGGYHSMSVAALATAARVSPQTVYNAVGSKAEVVKAVYDLLLAGDESTVPMSERPQFLAVGEAPDRDSFGRAYAAFSAGISRRVAPLLGVLLADGAGNDKMLAAFVATIDEERLTGNTRAMSLLEQKHGLPSGRVLSELVDEVWTLTAPEVCDRLVRRRGWSFETYAAWLSDVVAAACTRTGTVAAG